MLFLTCPITNKLQTADLCYSCTRLFQINIPNNRVECLNQNEAGVSIVSKLISQDEVV